MNNQKLAVLALSDVVVFPNNEIRIEYDDSFEKASIDYADNTDDKYLVIVHPIDSNYVSGIRRTSSILSVSTALIVRSFSSPGPTPMP